LQPFELTVAATQKLTIIVLTVDGAAQAYRVKATSGLQASHDAAMS
jgi:hypothetical protein